MSRSIGFFLGLCLLSILSVIIILFICSRINNDKNVVTKYDERQQLVRGKGYKYAYYSLLIELLLYFIFKTSGLELPVKEIVMIFILAVISIMIHTIYCVFNDGYFGINNNPKQYYIMFGVIGLFNVFIGIMNTTSGRLYSDGKLDLPACNYICGIMFVVLGASIFIKHLISKSEYSEDDEDDEYNEDERMD